MMETLRASSSYIAWVGIALAVLGLALLLVSGGELSLQNEIPLGLGIILLALSILLDPSQAREIVTGRTARYGGNALLLSVAFIGILAMVNLLAARHNKRFDLTEGNIYSLSKQTIQVLESLEEPVQITAFMRGGSAPELQNLMEEYTYYAPEIAFEIVDPDLKPSIARQYQIRTYNTIVYESNGRRQESFGTDEREITASILKVTSDVTRTVYFLTGHDERAIDNFTERGLSQLKQALEQDNYQVQSLNLAITDTVPVDAAALVIANPTRSLLPEERATIIKYLLGAGKALIMQDPGIDAGLDEILAGYKVHFNEDVVIDPASALLGDAAVPVVANYPYHIITQDLPMTMYPQARSVAIEDVEEGVPGFQISPLIRTSDQAWGETNLTGQRVTNDPETDQQGPLNIAVTVENTAALGSDEAETATSSKTRLVVIGDVDLASNAFISSVGNADLVLNSINWLAEQEELVSIRPKETPQRELILTAGQARVVMYTSVVFLPLIVLAIGAGIWWNRR
jgi:ABC-type uncharacterized transport system involved in gliding motility auxiliary subunit